MADQIKSKENEIVKLERVIHCFSTLNASLTSDSQFAMILLDQTTIKEVKETLTSLQNENNVTLARLNNAQEKFRESGLTEREFNNLNTELSLLGFGVTLGKTDKISFEKKNSELQESRNTYFKRS